MVEIASPVSELAAAHGETLAKGMETFVDALTRGYEEHADADFGIPAERRRVASLVRAPWTRGGPVMHRSINRIVPTAAGRIPIRVHLPTDETALPALLYIHGGGWVMFDLDTHDRLMREYAARTGCAVVGIDYSLAPEAVFPRPILEISAITRALARGRLDLPVDPGRLILGGDSAGANLAVATALTLRDAGMGEALAGLLLNYGAFDPRCDSASYSRFGDGRYLLSAEEMHGFWAAYAGDPELLDDPLLAPVEADLAGLPSTLLCATEYDVLADDSERLYRGLQQAGVNADLRRYAGTVHSFLEAVSVAPVAETALDDAATWMRHIFTSNRRS